VKIKLLNSKCMPFKQHDNDAGWDLKCTSGFSISKSGVRAVPLGISVEIPVGHVGLMFPRSGLSTKRGLNLANVVGVIDSDYRGELVAMVKNNGDRTLRVNEYERICQLVIVPIKLEKLEVVKELTETERGEGGFGSTNEETKQEEGAIIDEQKNTESSEKKTKSSEKTEESRGTSRIIPKVNSTSK